MTYPLLLLGPGGDYRYPWPKEDETMKPEHFYSGGKACAQCGKNWVARDVPCPDGKAGCLVAHAVLKPACDCEPPPEENETMPVKATTDETTTRITGEITGEFDGKITGLPISEFMGIAWGCFAVLTIGGFSLLAIALLVAKHAESWAR